MRFLMPFIEQFVIDAIMGMKPVASSKNKFGLALMGLSGFLFLLTLFFLSVFGYIQLQTLYSPAQAALMMTAGIFLLFLCTALSGYMIFKKKSQHTNVRRQHLSDMIYQLGELIGDEIDTPIRDNPKTAVLLASLAGFVAGERLH